ncbi:histidine phosphatase family protein [Desulfonatronovibrio magnus]|uniref:histidine phosphatase family protein n=1 Tax=Desulfonatronovibrio magnus TaxID=698827 RepID=UPI0005EB2D23|nr:histidine phosphatase family protein [Desulfonatronovibrio magnus]
MKEFAIFFWVLSLCVFCPAVAMDENHEFYEIPAWPELIDELRQGGFVLYMRHGRTDSSQPDQVPMDLDDCSTQRPLTDEGRQEIIQVGQAIIDSGIPVKDVVSSPLCRAKESARLAFGDNIVVEENLMYTAHLTSEEKIPIVEKTRELVSKPVEEPGMNRILVAHAPNLADLMDYFPEVEGTVVIFKPLGQGEFEYMASILPHEWGQFIP